MNVDVRRFVPQNALSLRRDLRTELIVDSLLTDTSIINLGRKRKFIPPPWYKGVREGGGGDWMELLPGVFDMFQNFKTILPLDESL